MGRGSTLRRDRVDGGADGGSPGGENDDLSGFCSSGDGGGYLRVGIHREGSGGNSAEGHPCRLGEADSCDLNARSHGATSRSEASDLGKHVEGARGFQGCGSRCDGDGTGGRAAGDGSGQIAVSRNGEGCGSSSEENAGGSVKALSIDSHGRAHFPAGGLREEGGVGWQAEVQAEERPASAARPATGASAARRGFAIENSVGRLGELLPFAGIPEVIDASPSI